MTQTQSQPGRFRPILTMVLLTILLLAAWLGLEVYFAVTSRPNPTTDYGTLAEEHVRRLQADRQGEDAWPVMLEAVGLVRDGLVDLQDAETGLHWSEGDWQFESVYGYEAAIRSIESGEHSKDVPADEARATLEAQRRMATAAIASWEERGVLRRLDEVAASGRGVRPMPDTTQVMMLETLLPELGWQRNLARGLVARMALSRETAGWAAYAQAFEHALALSRLEMDQTTLIDRLVGLAIRSIALGQIQKDLNASALTSEACRRAIDALDRQSPVAPIAHAFDSELLMQLDSVQWTHDRRGRLMLDRAGALEGSSGGPRILNVASVVYPRKSTTEQWFRDFTEETKAYAALSVRERLRSKENGSNLDTLLERATRNNRLGRILMPAYEKSIATEEHLRLLESGVRTMLAIELCRLETGALPGTLDDLVPRWLDAVPEDPFAATPTPMVYRVLDAETAPGYTLYSVGYDATDDGAKPPIRNAADALSSGYAGTDFILTEPRD